MIYFSGVVWAYDQRTAHVLIALICHPASGIWVCVSRMTWLHETRRLHVLTGAWKFANSNCRSYDSPSEWVQPRKIHHHVYFSMDGDKQTDIRIEWHCPGAMQAHPSFLRNGVAGASALKSSGKAAAAAAQHVQQLKPESWKQNHGVTGAKFLHNQLSCLTFFRCRTNV